MLNERQNEIIQRMNAQGEIKINELKEVFSVTEMTIRRDLERLEQLGLVRRTFGGAILVGKDIALQERAVHRIEDKRKIGRTAATFVKPNQSLYIDGGTTTLEVARHLRSDLDITVVTNALNIASELMGRGIPTIVIGGMVREATSSLVGPLAVEGLGKLAFDHVFLGASGLSQLNGFSNSNIYEAELKRLAISRASECTIVIDQSKYGEKSLISFAEMNEVKRMIVDAPPTGELFHACQEAGMDIVTA